MKRLACVMAGLGLILFVTACGGYYQVTDPVSSRVYYTTDIEEKDSGAVVFQDEATEATVTLQQSEIRKISSDDFEQGVSQGQAK